MIRNDRWIITKSAPPSHFVKILVPNMQVNPPRLEEKLDFAWTENEEELKEANNEFLRRKFSGEPMMPGMISSYEEVTKEMLEEYNWKPMIEPFVPGQVRSVDDKKIVSYGTSSYGYDIRCGHKFKIFTNVNCAEVDPKNLDSRSFIDVEINDNEYILVPPNSFVLTYSLERFRMPKNVTGVVLGKSTYARTGLICLATPLEAEWEGHVTLEFANSTPLPVRLYAGEGCAQVLFFEGEPCITTYAARGGKYQGQGAEVVLPTV